MPPVEVTVSQTLDYWKCPQYHWYRHMLKRGATGDYKGPADLGTLAHSGLEAFMNLLMQTEMHPSIEQLEPWQDPKHWNLRQRLIHEYELKGGILKPKEPATAEALSERLAWWVRQSDWRLWTQVLAAEKVFKYEVSPGIWLRGKADAFVVYQGKVWHVQWKTHSGGLANLEVLVESSMHEATFKLAAAMLFPDREYGGTMLGAFDKEPLHIQVKGAKCTHCGKAGYALKPHDAYVNIKYLDIHDEFVKDAKSAIIEAAQGISDQHYWMEQTAKYNPADAQWLRNMNSCADIFKKNLCEFRTGVCQRRTTIDDQFAYVDIDPQGHYK